METVSTPATPSMSKAVITIPLTPGVRFTVEDHSWLVGLKSMSSSFASTRSIGRNELALTRTVTC